MIEAPYGSPEWWESVVDLDMLQQVVDRFAKVLKCGAVLTTTDGIPITEPSSFSEFCGYVRSSEKGRTLCRMCDAKGGKMALENGMNKIYRCHAGLIDMAVPILVDGRAAGTILCGQVKLREFSLEEVQELANTCWDFIDEIERPELMELFMSCPVVDKERLHSGMGTLQMVASQIVSICEKKLIETKLLEKGLALMQEKYDNQALERSLKTSQVKALQHQLNPHFMFNTLNTIARLAMFEDAPQTQELAMGFSQYLRYVLRKQSKNELVDLKLELENVEHYLKIFKVRFDNRFDYKIMADQATEGIKVPFMILQPLVENAIVHGVEPSLEHCDIFIETELTDSSLQITVRDTGEGFESDNIQEGVGMKNIRERLTLHYGYEASVQVNSSRGHGTSVMLSIPMKERKAS